MGVRKRKLRPNGSPGINLQTFDFSYFLHTYFDKPERMKALCHLSSYLSQEQFWKLFRDCWTHSESLFEDAELIANVCKDGWQHLDSVRRWMMDEQELAEWAALPHMVTVYRGCSKENERGWSWTLDRDVAKRFASGYVCAYERYVVSTVVHRVEIYGLFNNRDEHEVVVNPKNVRHITKLQTIYKEPSDSKLLYNLVQQGKGFWQNNPTSELEMFKLLVASGPAKVEQVREYVQERYDAYKFFGFNNKAESMRMRLDYLDSLEK